MHCFTTYKLKNNIKCGLNLGRFILNEARFGFERKLSDRNSVRAVVGVQYPTTQTEFESIPVLTAHLPNHYRVSRGLYLGMGYNYYFGNKRNIYLSSELYYNYSYYDKKYYRCSLGGSHDSYVALQSMKLYKTGLKLLFGKKATIISGKKVGLELDFFVGLGVQYRVEEITIYQKESGNSHYDYDELYDVNPPEVETHNNIYPTLHGGIMVVMPF